MTMIYLDNNSSTPVDPRVLTAVIEHLQNDPGNPSSIHAFGRKLRQELINARDEIAAYLKVQPKEIIFTSGATEAINTFIRGYFELHPKGHIITSNVEHEAVYQTIKYMEDRGCSATYLEAGSLGTVTPEAVKAAIRSDTRMIALIGANNETGVVADIEGIAEVAQKAGILLFIDGAALLGKAPLTIPSGVSALCFGGHKIHAPQGVGILFVRKGIKVAPLIVGATHESGRRAGTENLAGIIGLAKAFEILAQEGDEAIEKMAFLRDRLESGLIGRYSNIVRNGNGPRVCNTSNLTFKGMDGEALLAKLDLAGIAVSLGSACSSGSIEPSRVLLSMGVSAADAQASLRFSVSRMNTVEEIDRTLAVLQGIIG